MDMPRRFGGRKALALHKTATLSASGQIRWLHAADCLQSLSSFSHPRGGLPDLAPLHCEASPAMAG